ncbi:hypothetical protein JT358_11545 [Micrococcales bacterium 31B]|nr:hypothetical protein [Micrococcales bacterium 31B]
MEFQLGLLGPTGTPVGTVYRDVSFDVDVLTRGRSTGSVVIEAAAAEHTLLADKRNTVALQRWTGTTWLEVPDAQFSATQLDTDSLEQEGGGTLTRAYTLSSIAWALKGASPGFPDYTGGALGEIVGEETDWAFTNQSPGQILNALFSRIEYISQASGGFGGWARDLLVAPTFTTTRDSRGAAWAHRLTWTFGGEGNLLDALNGLAERGVLEWSLNGRKLSITNPSPHVAPSSLTGLTQLRLRDMNEATETESRVDTINHVIVQGEPPEGTTRNRYWSIKHASAVDGVMTRVVKASGVTTAAAAQLVADNIFAEFAVPQLQVSRRWTHHLSGTPQPFTGVALGQWVSVERLVRRDGTDLVISEPYRVTKLHLGDAGTCQATLGSMLEGEQERLARAVAAISGGGVVASTGSTAKPTPPSTAVPRAPQGLLMQAHTSITPDGTAMGQVLAQWSPVTTGTRSETLAIFTYELESALGVDGQAVVWTSAGRIHAGTSWSSPWIPPGQKYGLRVRAVTDAGVVGAWSTEAWVQVEPDEIAPPTPAALSAATQWGTVTLTWSGRDATGERMPLDFLRLDVQGRVAGTGTWKTVPPITTAGGTSIHADTNAGEEWEYQARAVDRTGNTSPWSTLTRVTVASIGDDPDYQRSRDEILDQADTSAREIATTVATEIAEELDAIVRESVLDQWGPRETAPTTSRSGGKLTVGSTYQDSTRGNLTRIWDGSEWVDVRWEAAAIGELLAGNIGARSIKGGHIDGEVVEGFHVKGRSMTSDKLVIGQGTNLIPNADFEEGVEPHSAGSATLAQTNDDRVTGKSCLQVTVSSTATASTVFLGGPATIGRIRATKGDKLTYRCSHRLASGTATSIALRLYCYRADGSYITWFTVPEATLTPPSSTWHELVGDVTITNADTVFVVPVVSVSSASGQAPVVYLDQAKLESATSAVIIGPQSIQTPHLAANAVDITKLNVVSVASSISFSDYLFANKASIGHVKALAVWADMFKGKVFEGGTFKGQRLEATDIVGARIELISTSYTSGLLQVRGAGKLEAIQLDANGLHGLPDYRRGEKWFSLGMDRQLRFFGDGQGGIWAQGKQTDIRLTTDVRGDGSNFAGISFDTKHLPGTVRYRSGGLNIQDGGLELRLESPMVTGHIAWGSLVRLGAEGMQDLAYFGNCHPFALRDGVGTRLAINGNAFEVRHNGNGPNPRLRLAPGRAYFGSIGGSPPMGFLDLNGSNATMYSRGDLRNGAANVRAQENFIQLNAPTTTTSGNLVVKGSISATGTISGAGKSLMRPHPVPTKAREGYVVTYAAHEQPHHLISDMGAIILDETGTATIPLLDHWKAMTWPFTRLAHLTAMDATATPLWYERTPGGDLIVHGSPNMLATYMITGIRNDMPFLEVERIDAEFAIASADYIPPRPDVRDALDDLIATLPPAPEAPEDPPLPDEPPAESPTP